MDPSKSCITEPAVPDCDVKCVKKQNLLVYDKTNPCIAKSTLPKTSYRVTPLRQANVKKIKVCTGADLKRMCPPKLCACQPKKKNSFASSVGRLLGFGAKTAIAGGLVYWSYELGLWGKPDETEKIYMGICKFMMQPSKDEMEKMMKDAQAKQAQYVKSCDLFKDRRSRLEKDESLSRTGPINEDDIMQQMNRCQKAPSISATVNCFKNCWNRFVLCSFDFFMNLPNKIMGIGTVKKAEGEDEDEKEKCKQ